MLSENHIDELFDIALEAQKCNEHLLYFTIFNILLEKSNYEYIEVHYESLEHLSYKSLWQYKNVDNWCYVGDIIQIAKYTKTHKEFSVRCLELSAHHVIESEKIFAKYLKCAEFYYTLPFEQEDYIESIDITFNNVHIVCNLWYKLFTIVPNYIDYLNTNIHVNCSELEESDSEIKQFYSICTNCIYYDSYLEYCAVNPSIVDTVASKDCIDFESNT